MRELHGVTLLGPTDLDNLKQRLLLFDKLHIIRPGIWATKEAMDRIRRDIDFLSARGIVREIPFDNVSAFVSSPLRRLDQGSPALNSLAASEGFSMGGLPFAMLRSSKMIEGYLVRGISIEVAAEFKVNSVPIYEAALPEPSSDGQSSPQFVLQIAIESFPFPAESCSFDDILSFKSTMHDNLWGFRRFLHDLAAKKQSEAEIRDDIEWSLNEYTKAMKLHNLKAGNGLIEVYIVPVIEVIEDFAKFNWSKIAKGALSVSKRKIELLEAEMKAPGRECAYVFDARKRFGTQT